MWAHVLAVVCTSRTCACVCPFAAFARAQSRVMENIVYLALSKLFAYSCLRLRRFSVVAALLEMNPFFGAPHLMAFTGFTKCRRCHFRWYGVSEPRITLYQTSSPPHQSSLTHGDEFRIPSAFIIIFILCSHCVGPAISCETHKSTFVQHRRTSECARKNKWVFYVSSPPQPHTLSGTHTQTTHAVRTDPSGNEDGSTVSRYFINMQPVKTTVDTRNDSAKGFSSNIYSYLGNYYYF